MSVIVSIGTAVPSYRHSQQAILDFMLRYLPFDSGQARVMKAVYQNSSIQHRHSVLQDYGSEADSPENFYNHSMGLEPFPLVDARLNVFNVEAPKLGLQSANNALAKLADQGVGASDITHVISMTCTGMAAPGLDIDMVNALGLPATTSRTSVNFMGCYAAFHALKQADAICRAYPDSVVLIVGVELCTLHFQKQLTTDHMMANAIFADGSASVLVMGRERAANLSLAGLRCQTFGSMIASQGAADMAWAVGPFGFEMTLSSYVPTLVEQGVGELLTNFFKQAHLALEAVDHWAIHPGGKKILDATAKASGLTRHDLAHSFEVLSENGNMSSVSVLFVLERIMREIAEKQAEGEHHDSETVFAAGFGPGLTLEAAVFQSVQNTKKHLVEAHAVA